MKERLVKGRHVLGVIEILEQEGRLETLPELSPPGADLIRKAVYPTTWYQLRAFDDLLQSVHRYVFDGSEAAGQRMGAMLARGTFANPRVKLEPPRTPERTGRVMAEFWKSHFNFAAVEFEPAMVDGSEAVRIRVTGFPDMSACLGHVVMGFCAQALQSGAGHAGKLHLEERPWMHHGVLTFTLSAAPE